MKITITASLTDEELNILASTKGYEKIITSFEDVETPYEAYTMWEVAYPAWVSISKQPVQIDNPQSQGDYIRQVYEGIIISDATRIFTDYRSQQLKEQQALLEQAVREWVAASITSAIK